MVVKTHNIIFAKISAALHFNNFQRHAFGIFSLCLMPSGI